jgi:hypothetical protein
MILEASQEKQKAKHKWEGKEFLTISKVGRIALVFNTASSAT